MFIIGLPFATVIFYTIFMVFELSNLSRYIHKLRNEPTHRFVPSSPSFNWNYYNYLCRLIPLNLFNQVHHCVCHLRERGGGMKVNRYTNTTRATHWNVPFEMEMLIYPMQRANNTMLAGNMRITLDDCAALCKCLNHSIRS